MKSIALILSVLVSTSAFAKTLLTPMEDNSVPAAMVYDIKPAFSEDEVINATLLTVFRGSAIGYSSVIVTFADSLEDATFSFEFTQLLDVPQSVKITKMADGTYLMSMDVVNVSYNEETAEFESKPGTIELSVTKDEYGNYEVYRL